MDREPFGLNPEVVEERIEQACHRAEEIAHQLENAVQRSKGLSEGAVRQIESIEEACHHAATVRVDLTRRAEQLDQAGRDTQERIAGLTDELRTGEHLYSETRQLTAELSARTQASRAQVAEITSVMAAATEARVSADAAAGAVKLEVEVAEEAACRVASLSSALNEATRRAAGGVADATAAADRILATLTDTRITAETVRRDVEGTVVQANQILDACRHKMREAVTSGEVAAEAVRQRVDTIVALADQEADRVEARMDLAARISDRLDGQLFRADAACHKTVELAENLEAAAAVAEDRARQCATLIEQMDDARTRLDQSGAQAAGLLERLAVGTPQVGELLAKLEEHFDQVNRVEEIDRHLQLARGQIEAFEVRISQLIEKPEQIAAEAKTQAAQFLGVCRAVRKVFAGLAGASLEAKQRTDEFHRISRSAETRSTRLAEETARAAQTLRAWVEEAVRVRARLAEYLQLCPGIDQTHSTDSLRGLADLATPPPTLSTPVLERVEHSQPLTPEQTAASAAPSSENTVDSHQRADTIARLLQDARQFADVAVEAGR